MKKNRQLDGLSLKVSHLGENDRLLTILSDQEGLTRLAVPGARRPNSKLSAATPLTLLTLEVIKSRNLSRVRHVKVIHSFNRLGKQLETLAAAQALAELTLMLVALNDPIPGLLKTILMHLERLEILSQEEQIPKREVLACSVQACFHILALGGYALPLQNCCLSGSPLNPPIGQWNWRCSLLPEEGFAIGPKANSVIELNPSELALLQRLFHSSLPIRQNGELMGPIEVWLRLLYIVECWIRTHLHNNVSSLKVLREAINLKASTKN